MAEWLGWVGNWFEIVKPVVQVAEGIATFLIAGISSYSAYIISKLRTEVSTLQTQLDEAQLDNRVLLAESDIKEAIRDLRHADMSRYPTIPPKLAKLAENLPSFSGRQHLLALMDLRFGIFDRSSVIAFTNEGIHWPGSARLPWGEFLTAVISVKDDNTIVIGDRSVDLTGKDALSYQVLFAELQSRLQSSLEPV